MVPVEGGARVEGCTFIVHVCLTAVPRTGFCGYLFALRIEVIILTDEVDRGGVGRGAEWAGAKVVSLRVVVISFRGTRFSP